MVDLAVCLFARWLRSCAPLLHVRLTAVDGPLSQQPSLSACYGMPRAMEPFKGTWSRIRFAFTDAGRRLFGSMGHLLLSQ